MKQISNFDQTLLKHRRSDGSFYLPAHLHPNVGSFFKANQNLSARKFCTKFAEEFEIPELTIRDRHFALYQNILHKYSDTNHRDLLSEAKHFSDPLAQALLARQAGIKSDPVGFIALDIWDTCYATWCLFLAGEYKMAEQSVGWLLSVQQSSGGWCCGTKYPMEDSDTTAAIIILFAQFQHINGVKSAVDRAFNWLSKLETKDGSIKTFDEDFGVPTPDTTAVTLVARKIWGLPKSLSGMQFLKVNKSSHWYKSDSRLQSSLDFLSEEEPRINGTVWISESANDSISVRFMGGIFLNCSLWNLAILELSKIDEKQRMLVF